MTWNAMKNAILLALDTIRGHKVRAVLTVLGVVIGTGTIIAVGSIIAGLDGAITGVLSSFGPDTMIVFKFPVGPRAGNLTPEERQRKPLTYEQAQALAERCQLVEHVSPFLFPDWGRIHRARYKNIDAFRLQIGGTEEGYITGSNGEVRFGRFFTDMENRRRAPVVVLGEDISKLFFSDLDPIGKWIEVDGHQFEVVGSITRPAASFPGEEDNRILLPYHTMKKMFPAAKENMIIVMAKPGRLAAAMDEVRTILRQERRVPHNKPDNFAISTSEQMIDQFRNITGTVAMVMVVLSSIGLLVGGIGVMNIMLVSVTERTREIGVRKALGARRFDIVAQFLTEAVVLTFLGGLIGMTFGWGVSQASRFVFPSLPTTVPLWAAVTGIGVSVAVGLFFGIWPANKAARLDPVAALRYE